MNSPVIVVDTLSKRFRIGERERYVALRDVLTRALKAPFRRNGQRQSANELWALRDVSVEIHQGEVVGLIGSNGAGKTTLLKILSRITRPTNGYAEIRGRVGSLLEVGTGFHPELTGRENIYLSGAILGMSKREIDRKFDEMVSFAEVERFLDTPLKHYSSGMEMRLAFAVAAHLEPEILLVDEVLAVGDAAFQKKCLGKMGEVSRQGRTIIFVSHNLTAVQNLCSRVVWLEQGSILRSGPTAPIVSDYLAKVTSPPANTLWPNQSDAPGNDLVRIRKISVTPDRRNESDTDSDAISVRTPVVMEFEYWKLRATVNITLSVVVYCEDGTRAFNTFPLNDPFGNGRPTPTGLFRDRCFIPGDLLNAGRYRVQLLVIRDHAFEIFNIEDAFVFEVLEARQDEIQWYGRISGAVRPSLKWSTELVEASETEQAAPENRVTI